MSADPTPPPVPAIQPGDHAAFMLRTTFMRSPHEKRVVGEVTQVGADGLTTIRVPQQGAPPMEITAQAVEFTRVRTSPDVDAAYAAGVAAGEARGRTAAAAAIRPVIKALWDVYLRWCQVAGDDVDRHEMDDVCEAVEPLEQRIQALIAEGEAR